MAQTLHTEARNNTLNRTAIVQYLRQGTNVDDVDSEGFTALAIASQEGRSAIVRALLHYGANVNKPTSDGRTPLYLAAGAPRFRSETVQALLASKPPPVVDATSNLINNDTPLMVAVALSQDPEVVKLLVDAGASTTRKNSRGKSAQDLADRSSNPKIKNALLPKDQQGKGGAELANSVTNFVLFLLAFFQAWKVLTEAILSCIRALHAITAPEDSGKRPNIENPRTVEDFLHNLRNILKDLGLEDIFSPNGDYCKKVAEEAAELGKDPDTKPEEIEDMMRLAMYQPVLYLDDSGSMKGKAWEPQKRLADRMARVISKLDPEKRGMHLRFINRDIGEANGLDHDAVVGKIDEFQPEGSTKLGTQLTSRILNPLVYDDLQKDNLKRPYLILVITDGCPNEEPDDAFTDAVARCSSEIQRNGYLRSAVRFSLSQIGPDLGAEKFLDRVKSNASMTNILYITSDRLDDKYEDLKNNEKALDGWLLDMMVNPVRMKL